MRVYADLEDLARAARAEIVRRGTDMIAEHGRFTLVLSGGRTPRRLYQLLEPEDLEWERVQLFFGDERCVPPDHEDSNYRMVREALLDRLGLPVGNVHRIFGELPAEEAASAYEEDLRWVFGLKPGELPRFDLVLLGIGADGHTASLFPGSAALAERTRAVVATGDERSGARRVTLTLPALNAADAVAFLVAGADKAEAVARALAGDEALPAARVRPSGGRLIWMLDHAAAARA